MESMKRKTPSSLSDDTILYEIFPRLPAKSIHRFRCVSTSFRRLTSDRQFISAVRRLSAGHRYLASFPQGLALYSVDLSGAASSITVAGETPQKTLLHANTVNGLLFTVQAGNISHVTNANGYTSTLRWPHKATVSNAATNETFQLLPIRALKAKMFFYFCHDPETNTYKVLCTAGHYRTDNNNPVRMTCSIFTLGADSLWRGYNLRRFTQMGNSKSVCINGTLYLTRFRLDNNINAVICAFVVETERFYAVGYPAGLSPSRYYHCHLVELKGALAVIDIGEDLGKCEIKVWIKEKGRVEFGDHESWTEFRIGFDPRWDVAFRLLKSCSFTTNCEGEIVMGVTGWSSKDGCWIFIYNVDKVEWTTRVEMQGVGDHRVVVDGDIRVEEYLNNISSLTQMLNPSSRQRDG